MDKLLKYKIAISLIPGIGGVLARNLIAYVGSLEGVFNESKKALLKVPGIGEINAQRINDKSVISKAEKEIEFINNNNIKVYFYTDKDFPRRLQHCPDSPILIYSKGNINFNAEKVISIVGTRNATGYGREICDTLIKELSGRKHDVLVVSGLAYGIDIQAHKSAVKYGVPTVAVMAHGLDIIYPSLHAGIAKNMQENGGLVSDFPSKTKIDPTNFLKRNRIIAGLADATIVVESGVKGGALVTADIASSYNRDVFAIPGKANDNWSAGCNKLIKTNKASLIESLDDLEFFMLWEKEEGQHEARQQQLFIELLPEEEKICNILKQNAPLFIDQVCAESGMPMGKVSGILLNLEFKGVVEALPGKMYKIR